MSKATHMPEATSQHPSLLLATRNEGKRRELLRILGVDFELLTLDEAPGIPEGYEAAETGETFEGNALIKAFTYASLSNLPTLADDSGLCVDALDGAPGVKSARYVTGSDEDRVRF